MYTTTFHSLTCTSCHGCSKFGSGPGDGGGGGGGGAGRLQAYLMHMFAKFESQKQPGPSYFFGDCFLTAGNMLRGCASCWYVKRPLLEKFLRLQILLKLLVSCDFGEQLLVV